MAKQFSTPLLIENGKENRLQRLRFGNKHYNEAWLRDLLYRHPSLLPVEEFEPAFADHCAVCRELPVGTGRVDLFCVNQRGLITIVETKLWRNPEARHSAVSQIIRYAERLSQWSYTDLAAAVRAATKVASGDPLLAAVAGSDDFDEALFNDSVSRSLRLGRMLLLIVGDGIREDIAHLVEFLQQSPHLRFTLGLVEMELFTVDPRNPDTLFVQPRILARTQEITRAVVEIKTPVQPGDVIVSLPSVETKGGGGRSKLTEELFFEHLDKQGDRKAADLARWVMDQAGAHDLQIEWGDGGPLLKWIDEENDEGYTFGQLTKDARLGYTGRLFIRCQRNSLPLEIARGYLDVLTTLIPGAVRKEFVAQSGRKREQVVMGKNGKATDSPPLALLWEHKETWFEAIDATVEKLRSAIEAESQRILETQPGHRRTGELG